MANNHLSGTLPSRLCEHLNLRVVTLSHNQFNGSFPEEFRKCTDLEVLTVSHNQFTSRIPAVIGTFEEMRILAMDNNRFYGDVPDLKTLRKLEVLWLHNNHLTGIIPENVVSKHNNTKIQDLRFRGNYIECHLYDDLALVHSDSPKWRIQCEKKI